MRAPGDHKTNGLHAPQAARAAPLGPLRYTTSQEPLRVREPPRQLRSSSPVPAAHKPSQPDTVSPSRQPKLLDRLREALRSRHYSRRTEQTYRHWVKRFIFFHNVPAPRGDGRAGDQCLSDASCAQGADVSASTQTQALSALLFLYRYVLEREVGTLEGLIRARKSRHLPVVMTREEVREVLGQLGRDKWLMASLMYGAGLRLLECLRLRVQDVDFSRNQITVRDGKERRTA